MLKAFFTLILVFPLGLSSSSFAEENNTHSEKIPLLSVITDLPNTGLETLKFSFSKESIPWWSAIVGSTVLTYQYDEDLLLHSQKQGRKWGIGNEEKTKTVFSVGPYPILRLPSDTGSTLYFLGDGWTHTVVALSLFANGYFGDNIRPYNTSLQLVHGMFVSTFFSQFLKRTTGRESPSVRTSERGAWRPFPNPMEYGKHTARYDAFPSGHVMTSTLTFTILYENYPEYAPYIIGVGSLWVGALGWQMMNNGVHWASDYPLGIAMGIVSAKMAVRHLGKKNVASGENKKPEKSSWMFFPAVDAEHDTTTFNALYTF